MYRMTNNLTAMEALQRARAIKVATQNGVIAYEQGKEKAQFFLDIANEAGKLIARKHGVSHRNISFARI